ncbi:MAG: hypothetical protein NOU37_09730 [Candidatus Brocadiales bacterium]|nr:hypothetical protein [Candidatus Bathyanammoxibius amoris]
MKRKQVSLATGIALLVLVISTMILGVLMVELPEHTEHSGHGLNIFPFHRFCAFVTVALAIFHATINLRPYFARPKHRAKPQAGQI